MKTTASTLLAAALLAACSPAPGQQADGGRDRQVCTQEFSFITVKVVDTGGYPVAGATVTGTNHGVTPPKQSSGITNANGVSTAIGEDLGGGTVTIKATLGARVSEGKNVLFTCGECNCIGEPNAITLTLSN